MDKNRISERLSQVGQWEHRVWEQFLRRKPVATNTNEQFQQQLTLGQRVADRVAEFGGSWPFIILFLGFMWVWMLLNVEWQKPFDPFPFILLNLVLSCLAALQAPVILMTQNRLSAKDRLDAQHDYEVNLKAEVEILALHTKFDELRDQRLVELYTLLQQQSEVLVRLESRLEGLQAPGEGR